jgi:excisionase family DNA binding protein
MSAVAEHRETRPLTTSEVAERLGVTPCRVRQLIARRRLPAWRLADDPGGWWRIDQDVFEAWLAARRNGGGAP